MPISFHPSAPSTLGVEWELALVDADTLQLAPRADDLLLDIGDAQIVVTEQTHEPWDLGVFHCVGVDPTKARYLLLKSRMYCRPVFVPLSAGLVECDSPGVTTSDYSRFAFSKVVRPVYPLDGVDRWDGAGPRSA